ncbi:DsbA family protein [Candidatus Nitrosotalea bavarica]|uniref:DsbA family protein n=1 Tax=Candidatus Nitrosotalea bavarica TaxID=1903277 RepID=UPI001FE974BE|nr:thioredoxin domain-containing protein [Candidatus Nitrosotalea bavarica]
MNIHLPSIGIGVGVVIAVVVIVFFMFGQGTQKQTVSLPPIQTQGQGNATTGQASIHLLIDNTSPILGSKNAPITMIEFGDYQCFYCHQFYNSTEPDIVKNYINTGKVRMVFKDFTIIGQDSVNAAHASHCAQEQGKFWDYHDALYNNWAGENTGWASSDNLLKFAKQVGLDPNMFNQCMTQSKYISVVEGSLSNAKDLGLTGTPDFFIILPDHTVTKVVGAQPFQVFDNIFKSQLKS